MPYRWNNRGFKSNAPQKWRAILMTDVKRTLVTPRSLLHVMFIGFNVAFDLRLNIKAVLMLVKVTVSMDMFDLLVAILHENRITIDDEA